MATGMWGTISSFFTRILDRVLLIDDPNSAPRETPLTEEADPGEDAGAMDLSFGSSTEDTQSLSGTMPVIGRGKRLAICVARPRSINEAEQVGERLKMRIPVILNLESCDESMAQRIADYMSGASHMVDVEIGRGGHKVWVYAPVDMEIEVLKPEAEPQARAHLFDDQPAFRAMASNQ
jgi:cell division inhibitor SepF